MLAEQARVTVAYSNNHFFDKTIYRTFDNPSKCANPETIKSGLTQPQFSPPQGNLPDTFSINHYPQPGISAVVYALDSEKPDPALFAEQGWSRMSSTSL